MVPQQSTTLVHEITYLQLTTVEAECRMEKRGAHLKYAKAPSFDSLIAEHIIQAQQIPSSLQ